MSKVMHFELQNSSRCNHCTIMLMSSYLSGFFCIILMFYQECVDIVSILDFNLSKHKINEI